MGRRGPPRTPTAILQLHGSWRAKNRQQEPQAPAGKPRCPRWLHPRAKGAWKLLLPQLAAMGLLARCDRNALARYCQMLVRWREAEEALMKWGSVYASENNEFKERPEARLANSLAESLRKLEMVFGLNPSARAALSHPEKAADDTSKKRFFQTG